MRCLDKFDSIIYLFGYFEVHIGAGVEKDIIFQVEEEEHLLAVSTWPMLTELVIHDNALTTHCSHMPPLLQMFLTDQLGIHVQRSVYGLRSIPLDKGFLQVV